MQNTKNNFLLLLLIIMILGINCSTLQSRNKGKTLARKYCLSCHLPIDNKLKLLTYKSKFHTRNEVQEYLKHSFQEPVKIINIKYHRHVRLSNNETTLLSEYMWSLKEYVY